MPELITSSEFAAPRKPELVLRAVLTDNQTMEMKTNKYTQEELVALVNSSVLDVVVETVDEYDAPGHGQFKKSSLLGFVVVSYTSYAKAMRAMTARGAR